MENKPKISVIIPTVDRPDSLKKVLDSLKNQSYRNFEVIIVDGGKASDTQEIIHHFSSCFSIKHELQQQKGLTAARNQGWQAAMGDIVTFTDDDVLVSEQWLEKITETFHSSSKIAGVSGPTITPESHLRNRDLLYFFDKFIKGNLFWRFCGKIFIGYFLEGKPFAIGLFFRSGAFSLGATYPECLKLKEPIEVMNLQPCNMSFRKKYLIEVGGFDEQFVGLASYSEPDLSFRIRKKGYSLFFNPRAILYHYPSCDGAFQARLKHSNAYSEMKNFIYFYLRCIKLDTLDKGIRFFFYLCFLILYRGIYQTLKKKNWRYLFCCLRGTISGFVKGLSPRNRTIKRLP